LFLKPPREIQAPAPPLPPRKPSPAPAAASSPHLYLEIPNINPEELHTNDFPKPEPPKPIFKPPTFGGLFSRSTRSQTKVPDSVLSQYPDERKKKP